MELKAKKNDISYKIKYNFSSVNIDLKIEDEKIILPSLIDYYLQGFYSFSDITKLENMGIQVKFNVENDNNFSKNTGEIGVERFILHFLNKLLFFTDEEIIEIIKKSPINWEITPANIPQFSNFKDGTISLIKVLIKEEKGIDAKEIGVNLSTVSKNDEANRKYGENHGKLAAVLDIVYLEGKNYYLTTLGKQISCIPEELQEELFKKFIFNIPIIKKIILERAETKDVEIILNEYLSESTAKRRATNIRTLLNMIMNKEN